MNILKRIKALLWGRKNRPSNEELKSLAEYYDKLTAELPAGFALDKLETPEKSHWLMLLKVADYAQPMGKLDAIRISFRLGYLCGQGKLELGTPDYYSDDTYWAQEYRERVSKILAQTENADTLAQIYYFAKRAGKGGVSNG